jgi:hypothetical protein
MGELSLQHIAGSLIACAILVSGCSLEDVDSDAIRTRGMFADILALAPGDGSTLVRVDLSVGGDNGTSINLVAPDSLEAQAGEVSQILSRSGDGRYEQRIPGESAAEVSVRLLRGSQDEPAGGSAFLPAPFVMVLENDAAQAVSRDRALRLAWDPPVAGQSILWSVSGRCIWSESGITPDDGSLTLPAESLRVRGTQQGEVCDVQLTLDRSNAGTVEPVLLPGSGFRAVQRRGVKFVSTPAGSEEGAGPNPDANP